MLREMGRLDDAEVVLSYASASFPSAPDLLINYAWTSHRLADWPEALAQWEAVRARFPDNPAGYTGIGLILRVTRQLDEADAQLGPARKRFPYSFELALEHAWVASCRCDWPDSLDRFKVSMAARNSPESGVRPFGWTESSQYFDRLAGVLILKPGRAEIAKRGM